MFKKVIRITCCTMVFFFSLGSYSIRVEANTVSYKISVTIPAIIGFNVPPYDTDNPIPADDLTVEGQALIPEPNLPETLNEPYTLQSHFDLVEEEVLHFGETVFLRTIVHK